MLKAKECAIGHIPLQFQGIDKVSTILPLISFKSLRACHHGFVTSCVEFDLCTKIWGKKQVGL
jgi:hypothetical protein